MAPFVSFIVLSLAGAFAQGPVPQTDTRALGLSWDKAYLDDQPLTLTRKEFGHHHRFVSASDTIIHSSWTNHGLPFS